MNYWLFDFNITETWNNFWLNLWGGEDIKLIGVKRTSKRIIGWTKGSLLALRISKKNDIIFSWFDFQAVLLWFFSKITFRKRYIVAINVMCKFNDSLKGKVYKWIYKKALSSPYFYATVTSKQYGVYLNQMLDINREYELIHDAYLYKYPVEDKSKIEKIPNSVFMGGGSSRDWDFAFKLAETMPDITFVFVMHENTYQQLKTRFKNNTIVKYDIPVEEFRELTCACSMEIMPITTEAPAGLQAMFFAAANDVFYMTNYTATSCEYITNERGCILPKDIEVWEKNIRYYLLHSDEAQEKAKRLHKFMETECSCEKFVAAMKNVVKIIKEKQE